MSDQEHQEFLKAHTKLNNNLHNESLALTNFLKHTVSSRAKTKRPFVSSPKDYASKKEAGVGAFEPKNGVLSVRTKTPEIHKNKGFEFNGRYFRTTDLTYRIMKEGDALNGRGVKGFMSHVESTIEGGESVDIYFKHVPFGDKNKEYIQIRDHIESLFIANLKKTPNITISEKIIKVREKGPYYGLPRHVTLIQLKPKKGHRQSS